jgi:hypothetical protein
MTEIEKQSEQAKTYTHGAKTKPTQNKNNNGMLTQTKKIAEQNHTVGCPNKPTSRKENIRFIRAAHDTRTHTYLSPSFLL